MILLAVDFNHAEALPKTKGSCQPCHAAVLNSVAVTKKDRPVRHVKFSHELHVKLPDIAPVLLKAIDSGAYLPGLGSDPARIKPLLEAAGNQCQACHRGLTTATSVGKLNYPHMSDCLVCHDKIENPFSCETCHEGDARELRPLSHKDNTFADRHSTKAIAKQECAVCHGRKFSCLGCHSQ